MQIDNKNTNGQNKYTIATQIQQGDTNTKRRYKYKFNYKNKTWQHIYNLTTQIL